MNLYQKILPKRGKAEALIYSGYLCIVAVTAIFFLWSSVVPLADSSLAQGSVTVGSDRQTIAHVDGGRLEEIYVRVGDTVDKGQPLLKLDDQTLQSELDVLEYRFYAKHARLDRLDSEIQRAEAPFFRESLFEEAGEDPLIRELIGNERRNFHARRESFHAKAALLDHEIRRAAEREEKLRQQLNSIKRQFSSVEQQLASARDLFSRGFGTKASLIAIEREKEDLITERISVESQIVDTKSIMEDAELRRESYLADLFNDIEQERTSLIEEIKNTESRIRIIRDKIESMTILASIDGVIVDVYVKSEHDVVLPASPILEIVPQNSRLLVEANITPYDIDGVHEGADVEVRFPAFANGDVPAINGKISLVSADVIADDREPYYRVHITVDSWNDVGGNFDVIPGLPVEVVIKKRSRTLLVYILDPILVHLSKAFL